MGELSNLKTTKRSKLLSWLHAQFIAGGARRDAKANLDHVSGEPTFATLKFQSQSRDGQDRVWQWLCKANEGLFAELEDVENRISFKKSKISNLRQRSSTNPRETASFSAEVAAQEGLLLDRMRRRAEIVEVIRANYEWALAQFDSWAQLYNTKSAIYFTAYYGKVVQVRAKEYRQQMREFRAIVRKNGSQGDKFAPVAKNWMPKNIQIPAFENLEVPIRKDFENLSDRLVAYARKEVA